ncbi:UNVERIFIED_CONTAM: hypothetical protein FKN15_031752 [Acipenser sinensis]
MLGRLSCNGNQDFKLELGNCGIVEFNFQGKENLTRDADEENINHIPVIKESKVRAQKFDKFLRDNDAKRRRALKKCQLEVKENQQKEKEIQGLMQQLEKLLARKHSLQKTVSNNKIYEDYLLKIIDQLPENYLEYGADSLVMPIIRRHETLSITNESLIHRISSLSDELESSQHRLETLQQEHDTANLFKNLPVTSLALDSYYWVTSSIRVTGQEQILHISKPFYYLEYGSDSLVMPIIRRHETLSITNESLIHRISSLSDELESSQHRLETLQQEHDTANLMANGELSELQMEWDRAKERSKQLEMKLNLNQGLVRNQSEKFGSLLMAITNLADQCYLRHYGPLEEINILTKLDMIKTGTACLVSDKLDILTLLQEQPEDAKYQFVSVIEQTEDQASSLLSNFNDPTTSDIIVHYLRLLASSYLQNRTEFFQHFVEAPNLRDFCVQDVETMGLECDHVQILALSQALGINIQIECMEGADCDLNHHIIPDGSTPSLHLLYKTAHYDILYKGSVVDSPMKELIGN